MAKIVVNSAARLLLIFCLAALTLAPSIVHGAKEEGEGKRMVSARDRLLNARTRQTQAAVEEEEKKFREGGCNLYCFFVPAKVAQYFWTS